MIRFKYIYAFCTLEPHVKRGGFRNHGGKENSWSKIDTHLSYKRYLNGFMNKFTTYHTNRKINIALGLFLDVI